jgi:hypothetical protein
MDRTAIFGEMCEMRLLEGYPKDPNKGWEIYGALLNATSFSITMYAPLIEDQDEQDEIEYVIINDILDHGLKGYVTGLAKETGQRLTETKVWSVGIRDYDIHPF